MIRLGNDPRMRRYFLHWAVFGLHRAGERSSCVTWPKQITLVVPFPPRARATTHSRASSRAKSSRPKLGRDDRHRQTSPGRAGRSAPRMWRNPPRTARPLMLTSLDLHRQRCGAAEAVPLTRSAGFVPVAQLAKGPMILAVGQKFAPFQSTRGRCSPRGPCREGQAQLRLGRDRVRQSDGHRAVCARWRRWR